MADATATKSGFDWGAVINGILSAASTIYGIHSSKKTPNTYNVPPTPEEKWIGDAKHDLYGTVSDYTKQYMSGLGDLNPDYKLNTAAVGNPAFMGGIRVPTYKPPTTSAAKVITPDATAAPNKEALFQKTAASAEPPPDRDIVFDDEFGGGGGGPRDGESIYDYLGRNPGGNVGDNLPNHGQGASRPDTNPRTTDGTPITAGTLTPAQAATTTDFAALDAFYQSAAGSPYVAKAHELITKYGSAASSAAGALGGPMAALVTRAILWIAGKLTGKH